MSGSCMMTSRLLPSRCSMTSQKTSLASEKPCESNWTRYVLLTLLRRVASRSSLRIAVSGKPMDPPPPNQKEAHTHTHTVGQIDR